MAYTTTTRANNSIHNSNASSDVIRDSRFLTRPVSSELKAPLANSLAYYRNWSDEIERKIAHSFEQKNIIGLAQMLCNYEQSPLYMRKKTDSPLYVFAKPETTAQVQAFKDKVGLAETAVFLLIKDKDLSFREIVQAYNIFLVKNSIYNVPSNLLEEFKKRLGLLEHQKKRDEIIEKLRSVGRGLGFTDK